MKLLLTRQVFTDKSTIGTLAVDGVVACQTLEDRVRRDDPTTVADEGRKVPGSTAIPAGRYQVVLTESDRVAQGTLWSPRADHKLPLLVDVPGFTSASASTPATTIATPRGASWSVVRVAGT
jgi:hypothetical protein